MLRLKRKCQKLTYIGGGPSPSGSSFRHSYGLAAVSSAHTSAKALFPREHSTIIYVQNYTNITARN